MTRNPKRIPRLLRLLEREWKKHPDMRLGQLLVIGVTGIKGQVPTRAQIFNAEDDEFEEWLKKGGVEEL